MMPEDKGDDLEPQVMVEDEALATAKQAGAETAASSKSSRRWPWLILPVLLLAGLVGWFALPQESRQSYLQNIGISAMHQKVSSDTVTEEPATDSSDPQSEQQAVSMATAVPEEAAPAAQEESAPSTESQPLPETTAPAIDAAILERLIDAVGELRAGIDELKSSNSELKSSLEARRILDLKSRLRWLANRDMSLSQIKLAWEDIALLPGLSGSDHALARKMVNLSSHDLNEVGKWLHRIDGFLDKYPPALYEKTEKSADGSWWAWLRNMLHLRRAPSAESLQKNELHDGLLRAHDRLSRQQWPEPKAWQALLASIQVQEGEDMDIQLPEDFKPVQHDISRLRAAAATWLGRL